MAEPLPVVAGLNRLMAVLVVVAAVGGVVYVSQMVRAGRSGSPDDDTWGLAHLPMQAAFGLAVVASAAPALWTGTAHARGWRVLTTATTVSAGWLGAVSVAYPTHLGSLGTTFGACAVMWGVLFAGAQFGPADRARPRT